MTNHVPLGYRQKGRLKRVFSLTGMALSLGLTVTACAPIEDLAGYPGGPAGRLQNSVLPTTSQTGRSARLALETMMVSTLTAATVSTATEAEVAQVYVNRLYGNMADVQTAATSQCPDLNIKHTLEFAKDCTAASPSGLAFETLTERADRHLFGLAKTGLGRTHLARALGDLEQFDLAAVFGLVRAAFEDIPIMDEVAASYRDGILILGHAVATSRGCIEDPKGKTLDDCRALRALLIGQSLPEGSSVRVKEGRTLEAMRALSLALIQTPNFQWTLNQHHIDVIDGVILRACESLARRAGSQTSQCAVSVDPSPAPSPQSSPQTSGQGVVSNAVLPATAPRTRFLQAFGKGS